MPAVERLLRPLAPYVAHPAPSPSLTIAVRRWPLATVLRRPHRRLDEVLWHPDRRLPPWLRCYLLVDWPVPTTTLPAAPTLFRSGPATVPSCLAVQAVLAAIHHAGPAASEWTPLAQAQPAFYWRKPGGAITVSVPLLWGDAPPGRACAAAWKVARGLDDLDGDVLLVALAHSLVHGRPDGTTWITADAILDERGLRPKSKRAGAARYQAGHRREDRECVAVSMERLGRLWLNLAAVAAVERYGAGGHRCRRDDEGALLIISERLVHGEGEGELPVAWRFRPGPWLAPFLAPPNRQTVDLIPAVLRYDPYHQRWEKRLGRYLTFHLRMDARRARGAPLVRRLGPLLDELCLPMDRRHPERTRTRCETALNRLARDGVIGAWVYTFRSQADLAALPARRWLDLWRGAAIAISAPHRPAHTA